MEADVFIGLDVHKSSITVAIADAGRVSEVRRYGAIPNSTEAVSKLVRKIRSRHVAPEFIYEAGPCGYRTAPLVILRRSGLHSPPALNQR